MPPVPKPAALRQRRNAASTKSTLPSAKAAKRNRVPALPERESGGWHPLVLEWWASVWRSPMASEFLDADMRGGLFLLADLHQIRWTVRDKPKELAAVAAEIRLQEVRFGLSPVDRRRLQWVVEQGEEAAEKTQARQKAKRAPVPAAPADDPRRGLRAM